MSNEPDSIEDAWRVEDPALFQRPCKCLARGSQLARKVIAQTLPYKAHLDPENQYLIGEFDTDVAVENGLKFHVDWLRGQKTGFFVDQRENRALLERYSAGRRRH